ncbi:hypothetical protein R3P38DRAFT_3548164 [Favolaschia claudopus]|uniref:Maturase K n=1 Tax=Favolaschia claudopus TaxID=2862362 RepID=A0AAW0B7Z5_9AGAR
MNSAVGTLVIFNGISYNVFIRSKAWTENPWLLQNNNSPWGPMIPYVPHTVTDPESAWAASNSSPWSLGAQKTGASDYGRNLCKAAEPPPLAKTQRRFLIPMLHRSLLQFGGRKCIRNAVICSWISRTTSNFAPHWRVDYHPEVPALRKPTIWTWPFLLKLALLDEPLSIQEIIAEFTKRFTWCRGLDASWKMYSYAEVYSKLSDSEIVLCEHSETFHGGKGSCWPANVQSCGPLKILVRPGKLRQRVFPEIGFLRAFFSKFPNVNSLRITRGSSCKDIIGTFPGNEWFRSGRSHPIYKTDRGERPIQGLAGRLLMTSYNRYKWL